MPKIYVYAILIFLIIGFIKWYSDNQYTAGYNAHKADVADAKDGLEALDAGKVKTIIKWRTETKVEYRDRIKKIYLAKDPTGCADTKLIDMGFRL